MKRLFSLFSLMVILFCVTSCKLFRNDYCPSYFNTLKSNEEKVGTIKRVINDSKSSRDLITDDHLEDGLYMNGDEDFTVGSWGEGSETVRFIAQMIEYEELSDFVKDYMNNNPPENETGSFIIAHNGMYNIPESEIEDDAPFVEVSLFMDADYNPTSTSVIIITGKYLKEFRHYVDDEIPRPKSEGKSYYFNSDMTGPYYTYD